MQGIRNTIANIFELVFLVLFFFILNSSSQQVFAQQNFYDSDLLTPEFHQGRREALRKILPEKSCAVFFSNPVRNRSNDVDFQYNQDPDFYYLTGLSEPNSVLILFSDNVTSGKGKTKEILFIQDRDLNAEQWNGRRLGLEDAQKQLGINTIILNKHFRDNLPDLNLFAKILVKYPYDIKESKNIKPTLNSLVNQFREAVDKSGIETSTPLLLKAMATLREIKQPEEITLLQKAVDITCEGLSEVIKAIQPGMTEFEAQAIVEFYFKYRGAEYPGYGSIVGSGENSCVLHYTTNRKTFAESDLILMDVGAEYHGYTADITRTVPANGKFSEEQKILYELVLDAQEAGIRKCHPGNGFYDPHKAAAAVITKGLVKLGILKESHDVMRYFSHGTSHYLGMEVHDPGNYGPLKPGMVITVEPGIYIPPGSNCDQKWWNIGIRIEDDVLVTENEPVVLSAKLPKSILDIENLMREPSLFNSIK